MGTRSKPGLAAALLTLSLVSVGYSEGPLPAHKAALPDTHIEHVVWTDQQGAPQGVAALAQTADGFLWLGGSSGLTRFDGVRFEPYRPPSGERLLSNSIYYLYAPPTGGLWVGYAFGGFSFIRNGRVTNFGGDLATSTGSVWFISQDRSGGVWAGTSSGLWRFEGSRWEHLGVEWNIPAGRVTQVAPDAHGGLWVTAGELGAPRHLLHLAPGTQRFQLVESDVEAPGVMLDANGNAVTVLFEPPAVGQTAALRSDRPITLKDSLSFVDRSHSIWIYEFGEGFSVRRLPPSEAPPKDLSIRLPGEEVYALGEMSAHLEDREGNVWLAGSKAIHRFSYSRLIPVQVPDDAWSHVVVPAGKDGAVWIASSSLLQHVLHGSIDVARKSVGDHLQLAFVSSDNAFWVGCTNGLWRESGGTWARVDLPPGMADHAAYLQTMTQDGAGGLWVSFGRHGLFRLADGRWTSYGGHGDLPKTGVISEFSDQLGRIWFGYTNNLLAVLDGERVQTFGPGDGIQLGNITAINAQSETVWIGGEFGLQRLDHGHFRVIEALDEEWLKGISGIVETSNGDLWLNGLAGIFHIPSVELAEALNDPAHRVVGQHFGRGQGAPGVPAQLRPLPSAVEAGDGRLWFAGNEGVVSLDPAALQESASAPSVAVESIAADGKFYPSGTLSRLPPRTAEVTFDYGAASLSDPEAIRFRYKLDEADSGWHEVRGLQPVIYRNLPPGTYHFRVGVTDTNGVWSDQEATADFVMLPAFYQTRWFYALCALTAAAVLWAVYGVRMRQVRSQVRGRLEERLIERERIARDLHDTLLQGIQGLILRFQVASDRIPRGEPARDLMERALERADQVLEESRSRVKELRAPLGGAGELSEALAETAQPLSAAHSVPFSIDVEGVPRALHPIVREEAYLIATEALINAYRHANATRIAIKLAYGDAAFTVTVRDDGQGIDGSVLTAGGRPEHWGLLGMRERARRIRGQLTIQSTPHTGTEVQLRLPAEMAYHQAGATPSARWWRRLFSFSAGVLPLA